VPDFGIVSFKGPWNSAYAKFCPTVTTDAYSLMGDILVEGTPV